MIWRRRNYLINKDFQLRFTGQILFGIIIMALVCAFTVYYTTWARIMDAFYNVPQIASQFAPLFASINQTLLLLLILFLIVAGVVAIFTSHHIAGPMFRFEKTIRSMIAGDLTLRIGLRKTDEFRQFADLLNQLVENLGNDLGTVRCSAQEMDEAIQRIDAKAAPKRGKGVLPEEVVKDLECLKTSLKQLQNDIHKYKLGNN